MQGLGILSPADESELRISEERLAMPSASESRESLGALLAEDFREFCSSGRITDATSTLDALITGGRRCGARDVCLAQRLGAGLEADGVA